MVIRHRLGIKTEDPGELTVIHLETDADMVMVDQENDTLSNVLAKMKTGNGISLGQGERVVISSSAKGLVVSDVTDVELGYLTGASGNIQTQLNTKAASGHNHDSAYVKQTTVGASGGIAPLGADGKIAAVYLPSYVDDVLEGTFNSTMTTFTVTGESSPCIPEAGKVYVSTATNKTYRWSGTAFVEIGGGGVALGETASTAYRGDRGAVAYTHSQAAHARTDATNVAASSNGKIKINGTDTAVYTHPSYAATKKTATASGATVSAISAVTVDATGHVTEFTTTSYTITGFAASNHTHTAADVGALPIGGGTLTGALTVNGNITAQYLQGTWLKTTATTQLGSASDKICVLDTAGWVYWRSRANLRADMGTPNIQVSATQPTNQVAGDLWFQTL